MQDNTLRVTITEKYESAPVLASGLITGAVSVIVLALLYAFNPYASGYGAEPVSVLHFASALWKSEDWQHCYLVPIAVGVMVYFKRKHLHTSDLTCSWTGLAVTAFGLAVYWLGFRADNIYLGYASFQIFAGGLLLWLCGWKWFQHLFFAWAFLVFLYPVPFLDNAVAFPLRMVMSQASVAVLNLIGIGAIKTGTAILSAPDTFTGLKAGERFSVDVADPCSGIRSLFALMMVSALYGYFTQPGIWRKVVMFLCSMPLAVLGNLARILMLTIGTIALGSEAAIGPADDPSTFHMLAGFLVFGVAIMGLIGIGRLLNMDWPAALDQGRRFFHSQQSSAPIPPSSKSRRVHDEY
jgi:exosortase